MLISRATRCVIVAMLLLCVGGCSSGFANPTVDAPRPAPAEIHRTWPSCLTMKAFVEPMGGVYEQSATGSVPDGFAPAVVILCALDAGPGDAATPYQVGVERRSTELGDLISYLDRPGRRGIGLDGQPCPAIGWYPPWLFLLDADGRWIAPRIPLDACGLPLDMFSGQLPWTNLPYADRAVCTTEPRSTMPCR